MSRSHGLLALLSMQLACSSPPSSDVKAALEKLASSDPQVVADAFPAAAGRLSERISDEERGAVVAALEKGMSIGPARVVAALERDRSGTATRRYARAMLESGRGDVLGGQLALVLRAGDASASAVEVLSRSEQRDGSTWFPTAEDAGFFAGAIAWALEQLPDPASPAAALAAGMKVRPRMETESWSEWLRAVSLGDGAGARVSEPVADQFDRASR